MAKQSKNFPEEVVSMRNIPYKEAKYGMGKENTVKNRRELAKVFSGEDLSLEW